MYLLDTNVISELRQGKPAQSAAVRAWAARQPLAQLYISAITVLELEMGVRRIERRDAVQGAVLRQWSDAVRQHFAGRVLAFGEAAALCCAPLHVPDPQSWRDSMIAASALEHGYAVVTRNTADFAGTGAQVVDPWVES